jgi:hypothetical protein
MTCYKECVGLSKGGNVLMGLYITIREVGWLAWRDRVYLDGLAPTRTAIIPHSARHTPRLYFSLFPWAKIIKGKDAGPPLGFRKGGEGDSISRSVGTFI